MAKRSLISLVSLALTFPLFGGCAHQVDPEQACRIVRIERQNLLRLSPRDLAFVARGTPAEDSARSAHAQIVSAQVLGGLGVAALLAAFIEGFAGDAASNEGVRISAYSLGGGALGLFAISLTLGLSTRSTLEKARNTLRAWADRCGP
jgi:hypothetical protein